jgi:hypothetical protein
MTNAPLECYGDHGSKAVVLLTSELHPPLPVAMQVIDPTLVKALCDFKVVHHLSPYSANESTLAEATATLGITSIKSQKNRPARCATSASLKVRYGAPRCSGTRCSFAKLAGHRAA